MKPLMKPRWLPPYEGNDMASYLMEQGFKLPDYEGGIHSITNVHDTAIIITDYAMWRAKPADVVGFCVECLMRL